MSSGGRLYELRQEAAEKGLYVLTFDKMRWFPQCCKNPQIVRIPSSSDTELVVHLRGLVNPQPTLFPFHFVRTLLLISHGSPVLPDERKEVRTPENWLSWSSQKDLVQFPVAGRPEMIRLRPREGLEPGVYGIRIATGQESYPAEGNLVFAIDTDLAARDRCWDWKVEIRELEQGWTTWSYPCSQNALAGLAGSDRQGQKPPGSTAALPPAGTAAPKGSSKDILRQIDQEDKARIARYPEVSQRYFTQRVVDGRAAMKRGNWKRARMEYDGIITKYDAQFFEAHVNLSGIYAMLNEVDNAKKHFDIARQRAPQYVIPYVNMVYAYARAGNVEEARKYLEKVVELGYGDLAKLGGDEDLPKEFREDPKVQQLVSKGS